MLGRPVQSGQNLSKLAYTPKRGHGGNVAATWATHLRAKRVGSDPDLRTARHVDLLFQNEVGTNWEDLCSLLLERNRPQSGAT